jgi:hypothetical protein
VGNGVGLPVREVLGGGVLVVGDGVGGETVGFGVGNSEGDAVVGAGEGF